ncbi:MAG: GGDEF domain-containing protein [Lachnospiraceae bacterium]|nr:GGDEF domain-containing protein [Lachnospiraceae bacterium]
MIEKIKKIITGDTSLEKSVFTVILIVGFIATFVSGIITFMEGINILATLATFGSSLLFVLIMVVNYILKRERLAKIMLCYVVNGVVIPITFFSCGGIDSGMPLYMVAAIFIIAPLLSGIERMVCYVVSILIDIACILLSYNYMPGATPWLDYHTDLLADLSLKGRIIDMVSSIVLVSFFLFSSVILMLKAYQKERAKREELLEKLNRLSKVDELTGLYNRRELFNRLENANLFGEENYTIAMMDIDHFKLLNDTYGHLFGDKVLKAIANEIIAACSGEDEFAARYGGEEFILILKGSTLEEATKRIEELRTKISDMKWIDNPKLKVTISGGVVPASEFENVTQILARVDKLLYEAKQSGRDRIIVA